MEDIVKCNNLIMKHGNERLCDRFLLKRIDKKQIHIRCSSCKCITIITADINGKLNVVHVKEEENILCN